MTHNDSQVQVEAVMALVDTYRYALLNINQRQGTGYTEAGEAYAAIRTALSAHAAGKVEAIPEGWKLVPAEVIDRFPEINPSNYDHDDACALNAWGVELVLAASPSPLSADPESAVVGAATARPYACPHCDQREGNAHGEWCRGAGTMVKRTDGVRALPKCKDCPGRASLICCENKQPNGLPSPIPHTFAPPDADTGDRTDGGKNG